MPSPPESESDRAKTRRLDLVLIVLLVLVAGAAVFQLFLRFEYVETRSHAVVRIDRVSGDSCTLPCNEGGYGPQSAAYVPAPTPRPAKTCHPANVVRVSRELRPPAWRTPAPYLQGGPRAGTIPRAGPNRLLTDAVELSDGHVYTFGRDVFASDIMTWTTGQDVQVCATWSKLENRPYFSVGGFEDAEPATLAL